MSRYDQFDDDDRDVRGRREVEPSPLRHWLIPIAVALIVVAMIGGAMFNVAAARIRETQAEAARAEEAKAAMELHQAQRDVAAAKLAAMGAQQAELAARHAVPGFNGGDVGQLDGKK